MKKLMLAVVVVLMLVVVAVNAQRPNLSTSPKLQVIEIDTTNGGRAPDNSDIVGFSCVQPTSGKVKCFALAQDKPHE